jgi:hypothetical protein
MHQQGSWVMRARHSPQVVAPAPPAPVQGVWVFLVCMISMPVHAAPPESYCRSALLVSSLPLSTTLQVLCA